MKKIICLTLLVFLTIGAACGPRSGKASGTSSEPVAEMTAQEKINREIFDKVYASVKDKADAPAGDLLVAIAKSFLGTRYVGGTLEIVPEALQVFLDKTDCILFVELSTCFALTVKGLRIVQQCDGEHFSVSDTPSVSKAEPSYELLCDNILNMRYRRGVVSGYSSRVHYTSEWLLQNATNGIMREYTADLGESYDQKFNFMTSHVKSYFQLDGDPFETGKVRSTEQRLEQNGPYYKITQKRLHQDDVISQIKDGDIICFVDKLFGLDIAHVAIALTGEDGKMHFIHASLPGKMVKFEERTLADYATNGIRVARLSPQL